ncbi:Elongated TPR repeat-containing domain [Phytophthora cactorum]|nr:Elongated TPR repeat-containing domain [Phytophthora cactorum]
MDLSAENPFADLMTKAVKLKGAQQAQLRTQYDSWPQYFQHSLFMQESVVTVRSKSFPERIAAAEDMKAAGNAHFNGEAFEEAVAEYEKALAVFKYLENKDPGWKKKGIEDGDMLISDFKCDDPEDQKRLDALKVSCYLNIAVAKFKLKEYPKAYAIDPENREVRKLLRELMEQRTKQRALDKETFSAKGKNEYAKEIRDKIAQAQEVRSRRLKCVDFFNPTPEMIANAKESGYDSIKLSSSMDKCIRLRLCTRIDLTDRNVQQMLHDLQEEERNKTSSGQQCESKQSPPSAVESVDSLLKSMSSTEIAQLLSREGIDYHKISDREQFLETARQVLLSKLDDKKETAKPSYASTIVLLAVVWTLLRLYTSGGLSVLGRVAMNSITGADQSSVDQTTKVMDIFDDD